MQINATFLSRDGGRSSDRFTVIHKYEFVKCMGHVPDLMKKMAPVTLEGDYENGVFVVDSISLDTANKENMVKFIVRQRMKGIGQATAGKIYDRLDFKAKSMSVTMDRLISSQIKEALDGLKLDEDKIEKIANDLTMVSRINSVAEALKKYGGTMEDAERAYSKYGENAIRSLMEAPYSCYKDGMSLSLCDSIAKEAGIKQRSKDRLDALLYGLVKTIASTGGTCLDVDSCFAILRRLQKGSPFPPLSDELLPAMIVGCSFIRAEIREGHIMIYPAKAYERERTIAGLIRTLSNNEDTGIAISDSEGLDDDQKEALNALKTTGIKVICGGPGAGKTTTIKALVKNYLSGNEKAYYALCAPTGRAAQRISEATGYDASTIHKLLGYVPPCEKEGDFEVLQHDSMHMLPKGLFIIDEMSMVGEELFLKLLSAIPNGSVVILSGDPDQLKSVEPGMVLNDLISSGCVPVYELKAIHRQDEGNLILENYRRIKTGNPDLVSDGKTFWTIQARDNSDALRLFDLVYGKFATDDSPESFQALSFIKKGDIGKIALNQRIAAKRDVPQERYYGRSNYAVGDKVMMTRNNYEAGYMNGDVGKITALTETGLKVEFYDGTKEISGKNLPDMEHAWAMTVHKSQGSEYGTVVIMADGNADIMLYRSIILTAVTRAKERAIIISTNNATTKAIENRGNSRKRHTGLGERIKEVM